MAAKSGVMKGISRLYRAYGMSKPLLCVFSLIILHNVTYEKTPFAVMGMKAG
jgi:hypothetical protein